MPTHYLVIHLFCRICQFQVLCMRAGVAHSWQIFWKSIPQIQQRDKPSNCIRNGWRLIRAVFSSQPSIIFFDFSSTSHSCSLYVVGVNFYHLHCGLSCVLGCAYLALFYLIMILFTSYYKKFVKISHLLISFIMSFQHFISFHEYIHCCSDRARW